METIVSLCLSRRASDLTASGGREPSEGGNHGEKINVLPRFLSLGGLTPSARPILTFALLLIAATVFAQAPLDPPLAGRPTNYSDLIGRFTIEATVEPTETLVEDPITLRVIIQGDMAAGEPPIRQQLRIFPDDIAASFFLEPVPDHDQLKPAEKTWQFVWKLRPKSTGIRELPSLALAYYSPQLRRYQTAHSKEVALIVNPRPKIIVEETEPRSTPASFLELAERSPARPAWRTVRPPLEWLLIGIVIAAASWRIAGAQTNGRADFARQSKWSAEAVAALRTSSADPAALMTRYLQSRFGLAATEPTTADVSAVLKKNGVASPMRERWTHWYRAAAARRFAPPAIERPQHRPLAEQAIQLIQSLEAGA
jgi:hypothetical protein